MADGRKRTNRRSTRVVVAQKGLEARVDVRSTSQRERDVVIG